MFQEMGINGVIFGLSLVGALAFGVFYALLIRLWDRKKVEGQTANYVVFGVGIVLFFASFTLGLNNILILFAYFAVAGFPMVIEYGNRVHIQRRKDQEAAEILAKEALKDGNEAETRK